MTSDMAVTGTGEGRRFRELERDLAEAVDGEVRFDAGTRAAYSTDASNFRQVPIGVVLPRTVEAAARAVAVCRVPRRSACCPGAAGPAWRASAPTRRSSSTGRSTATASRTSTPARGPASWSRGSCSTCSTTTTSSPIDLRFGPEPATHMNCTLGGMIGNNSCGATAQRTGKVVDNIAALEVLLYDGTRFWCGPTSDEEYATIERRGDQQARDLPAAAPASRWSRKTR